MAKIQPVWAIDVGQAALKALKLVPGDSPDQVVAEAFDYIEYPKILSQPDADPDELVREALQTLLERNDLKGCKVAIAVPGQAGLVKFIKLPPVEKRRIPDIVKFEARQQIPFALEEVIWAYQQIGGDEGEDGEEDFTMAEVGLFAMKRDQINRAILPFRVVGIEVDVVQMGPIALYNFITFDQIKGSDIKDSVVLLDIGVDNTDLIITDGTRIWQRNVPIGGNHFTRALTKELKLTFAKAEHLKRNATKAPDPRSIFTAMRGVFNDFASEINRSIGFYTSVNRSAKIIKVVGLGNGFKLPGLQKFLQQNLSYEIEKVETFARLVGEDVKTAPQFLENLPSFGVAYGLGVQGLGLQGLNIGGLRTNLLPPEIEQVRLVRGKKPWALAASALLLLGFSTLFLGDYRVLAKVSAPAFKTAVDAAKSATTTGSQFKTTFDAAKTEWNAKYAEGKSLVVDTAERGRWPNFLKTFNSSLPDPVRDYHLDPNKPSDQPELDKLRIHVDAIKPVWRNDIATDWFSSSALPENMKNLMHPADRSTPPSGEGWIIQVVGHHYNPYPTAEELRLPADKRHSFGPYRYLTEKILPALMKPTLRLYGIHHIALAWMVTDKAWTNQKGSASNGLASRTVPILDRATAPAGTESGGESSGGGMAEMMKMYSGSSKGAGGGMGGGMGGMGQGGAGGMSPSQMAMMSSMSGMGPMGAGLGANDASKKNVKTLTRTDFLIQFVWQPPKLEDQPKSPEELKTKLAEINKVMIDAEKNHSEVNVPKEQDIEKTSNEKSLEITKALETAIQKGVGPAAAGQGAAPKPATPTMPPAARPGPKAATPIPK